MTGYTSRFSYKVMMICLAIIAFGCAFLATNMAELHPIVGMISAAAALVLSLIAAIMYLIWVYREHRPNYYMHGDIHLDHDHHH